MSNFKTKVSKSFVKSIVSGMKEREYESSLLSDEGIGKVENHISTRSIVFDKVITAGLPGKPVVPFGRIISLEGLNQSGKTTTMLNAIVEAQRLGVLPVIIDNEEKLDASLARDMGVDLDCCIYDSADTTEETFEVIHSIIDVVSEKAPEKLMIIFWDSLGATPTEAEVADKGGYSSAARVIGLELRRAITLLKRTQTCLWINNHIYRDPKVTFGDPWRPYGGEKPLLQATWRVRLIRRGMVKEGGLIIGSKIEVRNLKNNTSLPFQKAIGHIIHGKGWSNEYTTFDLAKRKKIEAVTGGGKKANEWTDGNGIEFKWRGWNSFQEKVAGHESFKELAALAKEALPLDGGDSDKDED